MSTAERTVNIYSVYFVDLLEAITNLHAAPTSLWYSCSECGALCMCWLTAVLLCAVGGACPHGVYCALQLLPGPKAPQV